MKARQEQEGQKHAKMFPSTISSFAQGMVRIPQEQFLTQFEYGIPEDFVTDPGMKEAVILYNSESALPQSVVDKSLTDWESMMNDALSVEEATKNCDTMNVIYRNPDKREGQCFVIVNNYESYHIQKWRKTKDSKGVKTKLQVVARTVDERGRNDFPIPRQWNIEKHQRMLQVFMSSEEQMKEELKSILERIAIQNTIIVMTTNAGQVDLLANFVCAARAKDMDISNLLVVTTDLSAFEFVKNVLGVEAFYNQEVRLGSFTLSTIFS